MSGRELPPAYTYYNGDRVYVYGNDGVWRNNTLDPVDDPAGELTGVTVDNDAAIGPALPFADRVALLNPGKDIGIIMTAKGGTSISEWIPDYGLNSYYGVMLWRINQALQPGDVIKGVFVVQGESDTYNQSLADNWNQRFAHVIGHLRNDLNLPDLPVVFAQVGNLPYGAFPYRDTLASNQGFIRDHRVSMIVTSDLLQAADGIHFSATGYKNLGERAADAINTLSTQ